MQRRKLNCATIEVTNNRDMNGRATADEINCGLRTGKGRRRLRKACLTHLGSLTVAGLFVALAPMPTMAGEDERGEHKEIEALEAKVASLQATVSTLQDQVTSRQTQLAAVQSNHALALGPFVSVDPNPEIGVIGPNITFSGANIHIVSGSGSTNDNGAATGLGNLIIGYDEDPINPLTGDSSLGLPTIMQTSGSPSPLNPGDRGGSHNLVIGGGNRFTQAAFGGFVAGERNTINSFGASVSAGFNNAASGLFASVSGGVRNFASGLFASISSGGLNQASGTDASVSGGFENNASGVAASVSGGFTNTASGFFPSVSGGGDNTASGQYATVSGGNDNTAGGFSTVVIGGNGVTDNNNFSIAPQPPFP
jgi:hypothetical protein